MMFILLTVSLTGGCMAHDSISLPPVDDPVYMSGSPRPRAPKDWTKFDWEKKKNVLFGQYAPTEEEKQRIIAAMPKKVKSASDTPRKVLVFFRCQYPHAAIASCNFAIEQMAKSTGAFIANFTDNPDDINAANLSGYDALLFNNTTTWEQTLSKANRQAVLDFVGSGKGCIGIHAAADSCKNWKEGQELFGAVFTGHPWITKHAWAFKVESPDHALNKPFKNSGFWHCEEVYVFRGNQPDRNRCRVLLSVDMSQPRNTELVDEKRRAQIKPDTLYDVAWIHNYGKGRVFYSSLGHNFSTYWQRHILEHYLAGIRFAAGDIKADMTPSAQLKNTKTALAPPWSK